MRRTAALLSEHLMTVVAMLLIYFNIIVSHVSGGYYYDEYKTENILNINSPLSDRRGEDQGWAYEWKKSVHCPVGTFITAHSLKYTGGDATGGGNLINIALLCSHLNSADNIRNKENDAAKILQIGVTSEDSGSTSFVSSGSFSSYANGFFSVSSNFPKSQGNDAAEDADYPQTPAATTGAKYGLTFHGQPLKSSDVLNKGDWMVGQEQKIDVSKCTQNFALCGVRAQIARPTSAEIGQDGNPYSQSVNAVDGCPCYCYQSVLH